MKVKFHPGCCDTISDGFCFRLILATTSGRNGRPRRKIGRNRFQTDLWKSTKIPSSTSNPKKWKESRYRQKLPTRFSQTGAQLCKSSHYSSTFFGFLLMLANKKLLYGIRIVIAQFPRPRKSFLPSRLPCHHSLLYHLHSTCFENWFCCSHFRNVLIDGCSHKLL